jgi:hypothetical protein
MLDREYPHAAHAARDRERPLARAEVVQVHVEHGRAQHLEQCTMSAHGAKVEPVLDRRDDDPVRGASPGDEFDDTVVDTDDRHVERRVERPDEVAQHDLGTTDVVGIDIERDANTSGGSGRADRAVGRVVAGKVAHLCPALSRSPRRHISVPLKRGPADVIQVTVRALVRIAVVPT